MSDLEGAMLSDYLLLRCINKGGIADVYRARRIAEDGDIPGTFEVAVKIFRSGYAQREAFRDYFMTEAEKIGQFEHPNILPFLEYGEGENLLYLVTPFITSGTLDDLLHRVGGHLSAMQALPIVEQLSSAVQYAHDHSVSHGNIKPSNVFIAPDGRMLLSDFGIARGYDDSQQSLTRVGWGSAEYAAPEQSLGVLRPASDIYSLGVLLFRILTGSPPFTGQTPVEVLLKHVRQAPPSTRNLMPDISDRVDAVVMKALQKRSDERFSSAEAFAQAYKQAVLVSPVASPVARSFGMKALLQPAGQVYASVEPHTPLPGSDVKDAEQAHVSALLEEPLQQPSPETPLPESEVTQTPISNEEHTSDTPATPAISAHHWSVDPLEWSPIAKEEKTVPGIPMTASRYLEQKPVIATPAESGEQASPTEDETPVEVRVHTGLRKWLPVIVLILLLIGLLGAVLSAFFYPAPGNSSGTGISEYIFAYGMGELLH